MTVYGTVEAAEYLGVKHETIKHYLYVAHTLVPDQVIGGKPIFTQDTLDAFRASKRKPGRPKHTAA